ncbi:MAG: hypothetical protein HOO96_23330 [Polyangiaceae bacterium]|nr:hypothetical protein [Polyangiaceae bacterium]
MTSVGCSHPVPTSSSAAEASVTPASAGRCDAFRPACPVSIDFPSATNSDHTPKCFPEASPVDPGHTVLFTVGDFGPPSMQLGLVGTEWWSWEAGGSFEPGDRFDVRVVVYQGRSLAEVEKRYPTVRGTSDYRPLSREAALRYLDAKIDELGQMPRGPDEYDFGPLKKELEGTRATIVGCLPP